MLDGAAEAFATLITPQSMLVLAVGSALGAVVAILPGISSTTMLALLLVVAAGMEKYHAFALLVSVMAASGFAGSLTAILLNVPGDSINASTTLDGFPLARQGRAGLAIGAAALASGLGAIVGLGVLVLTLPIQRALVLSFGPAEVFAMTVAGIALLAAVGGSSPVKGLIAGMFGMALGFVGKSLTVGAERFTFDILFLQSGIPIVATVIGLFAIPEIVDFLRSKQSIAQQTVAPNAGVRDGFAAVLRRPRLLVQSSVIGTIVGIAPAVGGVVASWLSYFAARRTSSEPETFGHGNVEGVIASEAAIDTSEAGSLIPVFLLGLPGSVPAAFIVAAFTFHGVTPGVRFYEQEQVLLWVMLFSLLVGNLLTIVVGLAFSNALVRITFMPVILIAPVVLVFSIVGAFADGGIGMAGIVVALAFGAIGLLFERGGFPRAPLIIGMILAPVAERTFIQAQQLSRGSFEFLFRPITVAILALVVIAAITPILLRRVLRRERPTVREADADPTDDRPDAALIVLAGIALTVVAFAIDLVSQPTKAQVFPAVVLIPLAILLVVEGIRTTRALQPGSIIPAVDPAFWYAIGWIAALPVLVWLLGLVPASIIYTTLMMLAYERRRPSRGRLVAAAVCAAAVAGILIGGFERLLGVHFTSGALF